MAAGDHSGALAENNASAVDHNRSKPVDHAFKSDQADSRTPIKTYRRRWYILLLYCAVSCVQCAVWNTFGPITAASEAAFSNWNNTIISMLSNMGCMMFVVFIAPYCWFINKFGVRPAMLATSGAIALGTALRCISSEDAAFTATAFTCAILNGIAGIMATAAPPYISQLWFPPDQRTTATSLPSVFLELGGALSFVIGPRLARLPDGANPATDPDATRHNIMVLMEVEAGVAACLFLAALIYYPTRPPSPPSASAAKPPGSFWCGLRQAARTPDLPWVVAAYTIPAGIQGAYFAVLDISVSPLGVTQDEAGWLGFWAGISSCVSALLVARLTDMYQGHMKAILIGLLLCGTASYTWLLAILAEWLPFSLPVLYGATLLSLAFTYATAPLLYEYAAELTYPVSADVIGAVMSFSFNAVSCLSLLLFLIKPLSENTLWLNYALVIAMMLSVAMMFKTKEVYRRTNTDIGCVSGTTAEAARGSSDGGSNNTVIGERMAPSEETVSGQNGCDNQAVEL